MPSPVGDEAIDYRCFSCFGQILFETCPSCQFRQAIPARWQGAFTCGKCDEMVPIPRGRLYSTSTKAAGVQGYGFVYPRA